MTASLGPMTSSTVQRCGGHITLLFTVDKSNALMRSQGSRGAGFSIHHGVEVKATLHRIDLGNAWKMSGISPDQPRPVQEPKPPVISVTDMHGEHLENTELYLDYLEACRDATLLRPEEWMEIEVRLECPTSQGFGMSAAGLVGLGKAVHVLTGRGRLVQYLKIAHRIERAHGAGLGDVLGATVGGVELRRAPGAPGWPGEAVGFACDAEVLLIWNPHEERHTSTYIDDPDWQRSITAAGNACVDALASGPWHAGRWPDVLTQSRLFATQSGMLDEEERARLYRNILEAVQSIEAQATLAVRLCMLGSSVVVVPRRLNEPIDEGDMQAIAAKAEALGFATMTSSIAGLNPQL